jgi:hypothetical protein
MKPFQVTASALINAPAEQVYNILADYRNGHPYILPKPYFSSLEVEQGGVGAGTIIHVQMNIMGQKQAFRAAITEPEPGRVLIETDLAGRVVTTFIVSPLEAGRQAQATITTDIKPRAGFPGPLERFFTGILLRRIYTQELALLAVLAEERSRTGSQNIPTPS